MVLCDRCLCPMFLLNLSVLTRFTDPAGSAGNEFRINTNGHAGASARADVNPVAAVMALYSRRLEL